MAHANKQGGKELLWMLGIPTVIAAGIFYWFINDIDSQFNTNTAYTAQPEQVPTTAAVPPTTPSPVTPPVQKTTIAPTLSEPTVTANTRSTPEPVATSEQTSLATPQANITATTATTPSSTPETHSKPTDATPAASPPEPTVTEPNTLAGMMPGNDTSPPEQQGASGAAGPDTVPADSQNNPPVSIEPITVAVSVPEAEPTPTPETAPEPHREIEATTVSAPAQTGWIYIGQFKDQQWKSSGLDILDQMPDIGEQYTLTWGANIRARPPAKRTTAGETPQLAENVGYLAIGKQIEVLNIRRSGNKGHIWVEIPR